MKTIVFTALLAFVLAGSVGCTSDSSGPYGDPSVAYENSATLYPISGTDEGVELFKDEGSE